MQLANEIFSAAVTLLLAVNPPASAAYLTALGADAERRRELARTALIACLIALGVLVLFGLAGTYLLENVLRIDLPSLRTFGGIVLAILGIEYVLRDPMQEEGASGGAVTPLALPLIAGPAAITTTVVLAGDSGELVAAGAVVGAVVLTLAVLVTVAFGVGFIKRGWLKAMIKVNGFLIGALGVKMAFTGGAELLVNLSGALQ